MTMHRNQWLTNTLVTALVGCGGLVGCVGGDTSEGDSIQQALSAPSTNSVTYFTATSFSGWVGDGYITGYTAMQGTWSNQKCTGGAYSTWGVCANVPCLGDTCGAPGHATSSTYPIHSIRIASNLVNNFCLCDGIPTAGGRCMTMHDEKNPDVSSFNYKFSYLFNTNGYGCAKYTDQTEVLSWWGNSTSGGDLALGSFAGGTDAILFHVDNPSGANMGYYRVAKNLGTPGSPVAIPGWWGDHTAGAGASIADIDKNGKQDLLVLWVDDPSGGNRVFTRIGYDLDGNGNPARWGDPVQQTGLWIGNSTHGADVGLADVDNNGTLDLIFAAVDGTTDNPVHLQVGLNLDANGRPAGYKADQIVGYVGSERCNDIGLAARDLDGDGTPDAVVSWHDDDKTQKYFIVHGLNANGGYSYVGTNHTLWSHMGSSSEALGIAVSNVASDGTATMIHFHVDDGDGGNAGYFGTVTQEKEPAWQIKFRKSGKVADVSGISQTPGAQVVQWDASGSLNQKWIPDYVDETHFRLKAAHSGQCMDVRNNATANGTAIQQWTCNSTSAQVFELGNYNDTYWYLKHTGSGRCVTVANNSTDNNAPLQLYDCTTAQSQQFTIAGLKAPGNHAPQLAVTGGEEVNGQLIGHYTYSDADGDPETGTTVAWQRLDYLTDWNTVSTSSTWNIQYRYNAQYRFCVTTSDGIDSTTACSGIYTDLQAF